MNRPNSEYYLLKRGQPMATFTASIAALFEARGFVRVSKSEYMAAVEDWLRRDVKAESKAVSKGKKGK